MLNNEGKIRLKGITIEEIEEAVRKKKLGVSGGWKTKKSDG